MPLFNIQVNNGVTCGDWRWLANDDELNHVEEKDAGKFAGEELCSVIFYITQFVDGQSEFKVRLAKQE